MSSQTSTADFQWNLPNALSALRMASVPTLLWVAWLGEAQLFLGLVTVALVSDILDGFLARVLRQTSEAGSILDSRADLALWLALPLCTYWLRPDFVEAEATRVLLLLAAFFVPMVFAYGKFRAMTSYHTWGAKLSSNLLGGALLLMWANGPLWPFQIAAVVAVVTLLEEVLITAVLEEPRKNVRSLWHVLRARRVERATSLD